MKKLGVVLLFVGGIAIIAFLMNYQKQLESKSNIVTLKVEDSIDEMSDGIKDIVNNVDDNKVGEIVGYIKEKSDEGAFKSKEGIKDALTEAEEKYHTSIPENTKEEIIDAVTKLEDMGFSTDVLIEKTSDLYDEYGSEFVDHMEEVFIQTAKEKAENAAEGMWNNIKNTVTDSVKGILK